MKLYLDDDIASPLLARLLRNDGHDVQLPPDVGLSGKPDPVHLTHAIREDRICLTKNYDDYFFLHNLILQARGHHPGIVKAIRNLEAAKVPIQNEYIVLNHWR